MKPKKNKRTELVVPRLYLPEDAVVPRNQSSLDRIRGFYLDKRKLPPKLDHLRRVYEHAFCLLRNGYSRQQTVDFLAEQLEPKVSRGHCYEIVKNTMDLFGDIHKSTQEGLRALVIDRAEQNYVRAIEAGDIKEQNAALKIIAEYGGLKNGFEIDPTKVVLPTIVFSDDPKVFIEQEQTQDIDHEELDEDPDTDTKLLPNEFQKPIS
jgi:hypothetical protein